MKFESFDHFGTDARKLAAVSVLIGLGSVIPAYAASSPAFGRAAAGLGLAVGCLGFYLTLSTPRRILYSQRVSQAREAVILSEAVSTLAAAMGSKGRVLLALRSRDPEMQRSLDGAKKSVLLGSRVPEVAHASARGLASYSAAGVLVALGDLKRPPSDGDAEESSGLASAAALSRETKLPVFMTVCFFSPVVMVLYSSFARIADPSGLIGLVVLEAIVLDLSLQLCSGDRPRN